MKGKLGMVSSLGGLVLVATMLLVSCASNSASTPPITPPATTAPQSTSAPSSMTPTVATPKYGGTITLVYGSDITSFDEIYGNYTFAATMMLTNGELWQGDWAKGPPGSGQTDWTNTMSDRWEQKVGDVAESWDFSQASQGILIFKIRNGIHWAVNPDSEAGRLVGGRELTASDVVFSLKQVITNPRSFVYGLAPGIRTADITAPDQYTVQIKVDPIQVPVALLRLCNCIHIVPSEVVQKYGSMQDWRVAEGTGSFILTDFVPGSEAVLRRNATYWRPDPTGPGKGSQLPYVDGVHFLIITDASTAQAAFPTGKVDATVANREDAKHSRGATSRIASV